jgi:hypothetical protein
MIALAFDYIPLAQAHLCCDCQRIGNNPHHCPSCASTHLMALAPILNREALRSGPEGR